MGGVDRLGWFSLAVVVLPYSSLAHVVGSSTASVKSANVEAPFARGMFGSVGVPGLTASAFLHIATSGRIVDWCSGLISNCRQRRLEYATVDRASRDELDVRCFGTDTVIL